MTITIEPSELHDLLATLHAALCAQLEDPTGAAEAVELDQAMVGRLSRMDAMQHQEMAKAQRRRAQERVQRVARRIEQYANDDEAFGHCKDCFDAISAARLRALPDSDLCVDCLEERNQS